MVSLDVLSSLLVPLGLIDKIASRKSGLKVFALGPYQSLVDAPAKFGFSPATTRVHDLMAGKKTIFSSESYDVGIAIDISMTKRAAWDRIGHLIERLSPDGVLALACEDPLTSLTQFALEPKFESDEDLRAIISERGYAFADGDLPQPVMPDGVFSLITQRT